MKNNNSSSWYDIIPRKKLTKSNSKKNSFDLASFYKSANKVKKIFEEEERYLEQEQRKNQTAYL